MTNRRQQKVNEVMGLILHGLACDQHLNTSPICLSVGGMIAGEMINNCIILFSAPMKIINELKWIEEAHPGVEITFEDGKVFIDCEHILLSTYYDDTFYGRMKRLVGAV